MLPKGAYPQAGLQLIEALRTYEQELQKQVEQNNDQRYRFYSRNRSEFSWQQILSEYYDDPLDYMCLHRANWLKQRPVLYVSIHVTERDNFVIEVRPCLDSGFRYGGITHLREEGDFRRFPIFTASFSRPSNRVLYVPLGEVASSFRSNAPWETRYHPAMLHAAERHLIVLATKAKLHQLSLCFECHVSRDLVEFGQENFIDFREPSSDADPKHRFTTVHTTEHLNHFDPDMWAPPRIREFLSTSGLDLADLYSFARNYLSTLPPEAQVLTYSQYLAGTHASRITEADVKELVKCGTDAAYRKARMLEDLVADTTFAGRIKKDNLFSYFCRQFDFTEEQGLDWVIKHQPDAIDHVSFFKIPVLIKYLKNPATRADTKLVERFDGRLAAAVAAEQSFRWFNLPRLREFLDARAVEYGFSSFAAFQAWTRRAAPRTCEASEDLAERIAEKIKTLEAEAEARRKAASEKRKATRSAKKSAGAGAAK